VEQILGADILAGALSDLADKIGSLRRENETIALIGVRSRGDVISQRLHNLLSQKGLEVDKSGVLDITLYRDDLDQVGNEARVRATEIDFDVTDCVVVLVDDVIHTGRTVRAALDALIALGRPKAIRLAVLIDRGGRELPIQPDMVGMKLTDPDTHVEVRLKETDGEDKIILRTG
jgi:pyrimidine operon attenuation protein/uracil phosphoribosyltransferase